jgi:hypothetical protein
MSATCTFNVAGNECGQPAEYEAYADHLRGCWLDDPLGDALCAEHVAEARRVFSDPRTIVTCNRCGMPYYRVRSLHASATER